jgi:transcriptional regulator with XRE-family HTH domain
VEDSALWLAEFGQRVVALRRERGLSQQALAHSAGLDPTYMSGVEQGRRNLGLININKIARALGVDVAALFVTRQGNARARRS